MKASAAASASAPAPAPTAHLAIGSLQTWRHHPQHAPTAYTRTRTAAGGFSAVPFGMAGLRRLFHGVVVGVVVVVPIVEGFQMPFSRNS